MTIADRSSTGALATVDQRGWIARNGINVVGMTMLLQFVVSFGFILVVNAPQNMVAYGTETFEARDFVRTGLVLTLVAFTLVMALGATYWRWLGYV
jgi:sodium-dependent dicarboxylate transporter 2/3/5